MFTSFFLRASYRCPDLNDIVRAASLLAAPPFNKPPHPISTLKEWHHKELALSEFGIFFRYLAISDLMTTSQLMEGFTMKYMLTKMYGVLFGLVALFSVNAIAQAPAAAATQSPQAIVESVAQKLFDLVKAKNAAKTADDAYYKQVEGTLDGVVNFPFIAASVMGKDIYAKATPAQREQFQKVFKDGMVKSLAKGVLGYADSKVTIAGVAEANPSRVVVKQEVAAEGAIHKLDYTMQKAKDGHWKLINVILNGVNLGQSFSGQFKAGLKKYGGDVDKVTANWLVDA
jgi:phospholipid transport system substrate-binding protein